MGRRSLLSHMWERTSAAMSNMLRCELPAETALRSCLLKCEPEQRLNLFDLDAVISADQACDM